MKYILDLLFPDVEAGNYTALVVIVCVAFTLWLDGRCKMAHI